MKYTPANTEKNMNMNVKGNNMKCLRREHCEGTVRECDWVKNCPARAPVQGGGDGMATPALLKGLGPLTSSAGCIQGIQEKTVKQSSANHPESAPEYQA